MILDLATQAYNALRHNRRRSVLTMLGMAWGIATVVLLLAYGTGFERGLWSAFRSFGTNLVFIFPGRTELQAGGTKAGTQVRLNVNDLDYIRAEVPLLKHVSPEAFKNCLVALRHAQLELWRQRRLCLVRAHAQDGCRGRQPSSARLTTSRIPASR